MKLSILPIALTLFYLVSNQDPVQPQQPTGIKPTPVNPVPINT